ncbi:MAG: DUF4148 domain-containing protein [Burkholderiales bacterium 64-34]|nr:MAG: DUF4148 domain-containing protein [Burkholderiales bacterium 64-34]
MNTRKSLAFSLAALAIAVPGLASASSLYHPAGGEIGYTTHPDHVQSTKSRAEVIQSVEAARKDGTLAVLSRGGVLPIKATGPAKTRDQVQQKFLDMSAAEKQRMQEMYGAGG